MRRRRRRELFAGDRENGVLFMSFKTYDLQFSINNVSTRRTIIIIIITRYAARLARGRVRHADTRCARDLCRSVVFGETTYAQRLRREVIHDFTRR